jgi:putative hydrolase of the HAD superfamily
LIIWSYKTGEAKPSPRLFEAARRRLETLGISAGDCAYLGNDMLSDIYGAARAGFKAFLFAGDGRSLRLREGEDLVKGLVPHGIIRSLEEFAGTS